LKKKIVCISKTTFFPNFLQVFHFFPNFSQVFQLFPNFSQVFQFFPNFTQVFTFFPNFPQISHVFHLFLASNPDCLAPRFQEPTPQAFFAKNTIINRAYSFNSTNVTEFFDILLRVLKKHSSNQIKLSI
jgi:hypothetical protein